VTPWSATRPLWLYGLELGDFLPMHLSTRTRTHVRRVNMVTSLDMKSPDMVVRRVHAALVERGHRGRGPTFSVMWSTWFPAEEADLRAA
jgi:hypothetical protein